MLWLHWNVWECVCVCVCVCILLNYKCKCNCRTPQNYISETDARPSSPATGQQMQQSHLLCTQLLRVQYHPLQSPSHEEQLHRSPSTHLLLRYYPWHQSPFQQETPLQLPSESTSTVSLSYPDPAHNFKEHLKCTYMFYCVLWIV